MRFAGFQKTSLIDYPGKVASVLFTSGCNLRCPYCHNGELIEGHKGRFFEEEEILRELVERRKYIDAVVVTGGEPTINEDLPEFLEKLSEHGFHVKLDTNGLRPMVLRKCLSYINYIAMDVKTSLDKYGELGETDTSPMIESIEMIKNCGVDYEFRCTAVPGFVETNTVKKMGELVEGASLFVFQQYRKEKTYDASYANVDPYNEDKIRMFAQIMKPYVSRVSLRI